VSSQAARNSITAVELTSTSPAQTLSPSGGNPTVVAADKTGFLRPRLETHPVSTGPERLAAEAGDRSARRSIVTSRADDVIHHQQPHPGQRPVTPDHLRVHTGTGGRASRSFIRFPTGGRNSLGAVKMHGRERRAGRTLIWVFAIFVALWLPFFCTNLAYGLCGARHDDAANTSADSYSLPLSTSMTTTTTVIRVVPKTTAATNRSASEVFGGDISGCNIPESVFIAFTWLGYLSSGVNPLIYTLLNHDFQNAFRTIVTCRYLTATSASRRQSRANLFS